MGLRDLPEIRRLYALPRHGSALKELLIPGLAESVNYDRAAGYFNSKLLEEAAHGVAGLLRNGGKMRLLTSHYLSKADSESAGRVFDEDQWAEQLVAEFKAFFSGEASAVVGGLQRKHVQLMCAMLREERLEVRVVVPSEMGERVVKMFHPKFGILTDQTGDQLAFSGSTNETKSGWITNLENVSTYPLWDPAFSEFREFERVFNELWDGQGLPGWDVFSLPEAVRRALVIEAGAQSVDSCLEELEELEELEDADHKDLEIPLPSGRLPHDYQLEALHEWESAGRVGLLEMATGAGKTFTAKLCIDSASTTGPLLTVVIAPYQHICDQWKAELGGVSDSHVVQVGKSGNWRLELQDLAVNAGYGLYRETGLVLIAVINTASSDDFIEHTSRLSQKFSNFLVVGDEVHWFGATKFRSAMNLAANFRLGLSATPKRHYDEDGTQEILEYFGEPVYEFDLKRALNWRNPRSGEVGVLTPYELHIVFVDLTEPEILKWRDVTRQIGIYMSNENRSLDEQASLELKRIERANIAKNAANKLTKFAELMESLGTNQSHTLVYCSDSAQLGGAVATARDKGIFETAKITRFEDANSSIGEAESERQKIIRDFRDGYYKLLFAIKALDEGVDIPSATTGIILASSGNPKEFIQRRGRIMRKSPGKTLATIYDFVVVPPEDETSMERLRENERDRCLEFARLAVNASDVTQVITNRLGDKDE